MMGTLKNVWKCTWYKVGAISTCLQILVLAISTTSLHYMEVIENDGLVLCEVTESQVNSCTESHKDDNDNDNETVQVLVDFSFVKTSSLLLDTSSSQITLLPQYKNSYHFAFSLEIIKPPIYV